MIIVDNALKKRAEKGNPLKVGLIGAGFMAKGIVNQVYNYMPGMQIVAIANRRAENAQKAYELAGDLNTLEVANVADMNAAIASGKSTYTDNFDAICESEQVEVLIEATGHIEFGANVTLKAINCGKHVVSMNAELDGTVGPILKVYADKAGVIFSGCDGDQPAVQLNLYRFVQSIGLTPFLCGNIKGLQDRYRNPTTQESFAKQWGQTPSMVTSFADGTKISFEQAIVANATGMKVAQRGMLGYESTEHVDNMIDLYDHDQLRELGGVVEYVVGSQPSPGVFIYASNDGDATQAHYLNYGKLGEGPLYSFYVPYHLTIFEAPLSAARVALLNDTVIAPIAGQVVDVITTAKIDLKAGETLDGLGHYKTYGQCENAEIAKKENLLPMGIAEGCVLKRDLSKDDVITYADIELPSKSLAVKLRKEQDEYFTS